MGTANVHQWWYLPTQQKRVYQLYPIIWKQHQENTHAHNPPKKSSNHINHWLFFYLINHIPKPVAPKKQSLPFIGKRTWASLVAEKKQHHCTGLLWIGGEMGYQRSKKLKNHLNLAQFLYLHLILLLYVCKGCKCDASCIIYGHMFVTCIRCIICRRCSVSASLRQSCE